MAATLRSMVEMEYRCGRVVKDVPVLSSDSDLREEPILWREGIGAEADIEVPWTEELVGDSGDVEDRCIDVPDRIFLNFFGLTVLLVEAKLLCECCLTGMLK